MDTVDTVDIDKEILRWEKELKQTKETKEKLHDCGLDDTQGRYCRRMDLIIQLLSILHQLNK